MALTAYRLNGCDHASWLPAAITSCYRRDGFMFRVMKRNRMTLSDSYRGTQHEGTFEMRFCFGEAGEINLRTALFLPCSAKPIHLGFQ